jgi:hypothetical protein
MFLCTVVSASNLVHCIAYLYTYFAPVYWSTLQNYFEVHFGTLDSIPVCTFLLQYTGVHCNTGAVQKTQIHISQRQFTQND